MFELRESYLRELSPAFPACDQTEKPHVVAFRDHVLANYGGGDLGILRACNIGRPSLHHQGLAWDWALDAANLLDQRAVDSLINDLGFQGWVQAGLSLLIWNKKTYKPSRGWQLYDGFGQDGTCQSPPCRDPHTGHVHFSFGAVGGTLPLPPPPAPVFGKRATEPQVTSYAFPAVVAGFALGAAVTILAGRGARRG